METELHGHEKRLKRAKDLWLRVVTDLNSGMTPADIAKRYTNPVTKKPYTREHIYWIIREVKTRNIK